MLEKQQAFDWGKLTEVTPGNYDHFRLNWTVFFNRYPFTGPENIRSRQNSVTLTGPIDYDTWFDFLANVSKSQHAASCLYLTMPRPVDGAS
ncbi:hypothetical protein FRC10_011539 [Ceratobasidium sp. 414]|nr:hypothetical protein FRC10_011539 [Ceratobasidium sp. 414]